MLHLCPVSTLFSLRKILLNYQPNMHQNDETEIFFLGKSFFMENILYQKNILCGNQTGLKQILVEKEKKSAVETGHSSWHSCSDDRRRQNKVCLFPLLFHQWTKSAETTVSTFFPPDLVSIPHPCRVDTGSSSKTGNPCKIDKDIKQHRESEMFNE